MWSLFSLNSLMSATALIIAHFNYRDDPTVGVQQDYNNWQTGKVQKSVSKDSVKNYLTQRRSTQLAAQYSNKQMKESWLIFNL